MEVRNGKVVFRWSEVANLLPRGLAPYGYKLSEIIDQSIEFKVSDGKIEFICKDNDVFIVVSPKHCAERLSEFVAICESVLQNAVNQGVFAELETAVTVALHLENYIRRVVRDELKRQAL